MNPKMRPTQDVELQELLDALTAELQTDEDGDAALDHAQKRPAPVSGFVNLIRSLNALLRPVAPRPGFVRELRLDLLDAERAERRRQMPARVSMAALLALLAGCVLIMLRRLFGSEAASEIQEEAVASSA